AWDKTVEWAQSWLSNLLDIIAALPTTLQVLAQGVRLPGQLRTSPKKAHSALRGWLGGPARAAKTRAGRAGLSASRAEIASGSGLRVGGRSCGDLPLRLGGERPNQGNDPSDESPPRQKVQQ